MLADLLLNTQSHEPRRQRPGSRCHFNILAEVPCGVLQLVTSGMNHGGKLRKIGVCARAYRHLLIYECINSKSKHTYFLNYSENFKNSYGLRKY